MNHYQRRVLCACLLTLALGFSRAVAQDEPKVKITPNQEAAQSQPNSKVPETDQPFQPRPSATVVRSVSAVSRLLAGDQTYQRGDLLTWEQVKPVLDRLRRARVPMPPEKQLRPRFLSRNDPLVRMLSTERGKAFFQELGKNPSSIDRVDHYRSLPRGERFLQQMINDKGGYEFFTEPYWLTERDAKWAERWTLRNVPNGRQFGEPTGRIYTESQLISFLAKYRKSGTARTYE